MDSWMYVPSIRPANNHDPATTSRENPGDLTNLSAAHTATYHDTSSHADSSSKSGGPRIRRRNRQITSCLGCRRRKLKCDKTAPCTNCTRFRRDCLYLAPATDSVSQQRLAKMKENKDVREKTLESRAAAQNHKAHLGGGNVTRLTAEQISPDAKEEEDETNEDEYYLEPTPLATADNVYENDNDDEFMDLGVQMGKMRITERIGGWIRPKLVDEINDTLEDVQSGKSQRSKSTIANENNGLHPGTKSVQAARKSFIGPSDDYIGPSSAFFFPGTNMSTTLVDYLPTRNAADQFISQYWHAVHYMCKIVHRPTFEAQYTLFWNQVDMGSEPAPSVQAVMFAAMFSSAASFTDEQVMQRFGTTKSSLVDALRSGTEFALARANILMTTKVDTMQAFVMYLIPLVRAEVSRAHSALVGTAIRLAECMGLHRDGTLYNMSPVEVQVRRMVWHQLCFLDMRSSLATGPRPQIRAEDYDTKFHGT